MVRRVCRELGTQARASSSSTTRPTTATGIAAAAKPRTSCPTRARPRASRRPRSARRKPASGSPASRRSTPSSASRPSTTSRPRRSSSRGSGYPEGHALPLGRVRLLADRRHRGGHRQGAARPGRRRRDGRRHADLPRPLGCASATTCRRRRAPAPNLDRRAPQLPAELEGALAQPLRQLRAVLRAVGGDARPSTARHHAAGLHRRLQQHERLQARLRLRSPAGRSQIGDDGKTVAVPGRAAALLATSTRTATGSRGRTRILVDSAQLESGEAMSDEFKKIAAARDRGVQGRVPRSASPAATPTSSPTRTCCAR